MSDDETQPARGALIRLKNLKEMTDDEIRVYARELHSQRVKALKEPGDSPQMPSKYIEFEKRMYAEQERAKESDSQD